MNYDFRDSNDGDSHLFYTAFDTYIEFIYMGAFKQQHFSNNAQCPVGACGAPLNEDDEMEQCEGPCHGMYDVDTMVALPCCQVYMCQACAKKWTEGKGTCPPGKCLQKGGSKSKKGKKNSPIKTPCSGLPDCEGEVLRNFPSEMECEHEVCINCLAKTLDECERNNMPPICPNEACRLPYRCETVLALKALFPERAAYFSRFDLESHYSMEALKDDSITTILIQRDAKLQKIELKVCFCEDEENQLSVEFEKGGPLGDLIREIRRVLKIMNTDKVYGYFRRDNEEEKQLDISPKLIQTPIDKIGITKVFQVRKGSQKQSTSVHRAAVTCITLQRFYLLILSIFIYALLQHASVISCYDSCHVPE
ncbi:unnamed protein product [Heligmosomoides polygyrus]|uniref:RING-type domain-containing protein n=1 Tax=Heligmosomoides polygyrus TaxID=6339 RepID=A0A3P8AVS2_HELPZ|nr:unnamed protein product [Heligmosomoides polygyrus]